MPDDILTLRKGQDYRGIDQANALSLDEGQEASPARHSRATLAHYLCPSVARNARYADHLGLSSP